MLSLVAFELKIGPTVGHIVFCGVLILLLAVFETYFVYLSVYLRACGRTLKDMDDRNRDEYLNYEEIISRS